VTIEPEQPLIAAALHSLAQEVAGLREDVRSERKGRHITTALAAAVFTAALFVGGAWGASIRRDATLTCESRTIARSDIRGAISASTDELARYAELTPAERSEVSKRIADRVFEEYGPPDC